mmetsp:Transcript_37478/g.36040  ORF Transcript_37478/g.36040 Transcript_37478/m.36040 type:complete len:162 (+) Transcript_37478:1893-2378(+)
MALFVVMIIMNCTRQYNERRILMFSLVFNIFALIVFVDYTPNQEANLIKYLVGITLIILSNIALESASSSYIMANLAHQLPSNTQILNAGFMIELVEVLSKYGTVVLLLVADTIRHKVFHNTIVIGFAVLGVCLLVPGIILYGKLRIRLKPIKLSDDYLLI